jgi:hypothetical protein
MPGQILNNIGKVRDLIGGHVRQHAYHPASNSTAVKWVAIMTILDASAPKYPASMHEPIGGSMRA